MLESLGGRVLDKTALGHFFDTVPATRRRKAFLETITRICLVASGWFEFSVQTEDENLLPHHLSLFVIAYRRL